MMKQMFLTLTCLFLAMFKILYDFSLYSVLFLVLFFFLGITSLLNYSRETVTFGILILVSVGLYSFDILIIVLLDLTHHYLYLVLLLNFV